MTRREWQKLQLRTSTVILWKLALRAQAETRVQQVTDTACGRDCFHISVLQCRKHDTSETTIGVIPWMVVVEPARRKRLESRTG